MTTLLVVIPALNEEDGIGGLELIVVDDGSTGRTPDLVAATDGARLIRHARNGGYGAALKIGFPRGREVSVEKTEWRRGVSRAMICRPACCRF